MKRILVIVAVVLALLAIAAAVILPKLLNPETYRPRLEQMLADVTGRSVAVGPMRLHVFPVPGITAEGFTLGEDPAFGKEPFLKAGRIDARVRLMPLFSSRLDIVSFDIEKPVAHLHRDAKGRWNLVSLMERAGSQAAPAKGAAPSGGGFAVLIERFRLIDGSVDITDAAIVPGTTHRIEGREIQLTLSDLSTTSPMGIDLKLGLTGSGKGALVGRLGPPPQAEGGGWPIDARVTLTNFIGGAAAPYLATYTGLRLAGGSVDFDATLKGSAPQNLDVQGKVALKALEIAPFGGAGRRAAPLDGSVAIDGTFTPQETRLRKADVRLGHAAVTLSGALTDLQGKPKADLHAVASKVALADVAPILSLFGPLLPPGLAMKGTIAIDATARGPLDDPLEMAIKGTATVSGFEFSDPSLKEPIRDIAATLALSGDRAELTGLAASLGRSRVQGACAISRFARPVLDVDFVVPVLDVDEILSFLPASGAVPAPARAPASGAAPSILREITVRGNLSVNEAKAMNLKLASAHARLEVTGGEARLHEVLATLYGGTLAGDVTAGLVDAGPPFAMNAKVQGVDFNALCTDFSKDLAGLLHGTLETSLDVKGRGLDTDGLRNNLAGGATLALRNGKLTSFGFLKQLAQVLEAAGGHGIGKDDTPFDSLTGTFDIRGGRATTQDLRLDSADLDINGKGSIGLDQSIGMNVGVVLSEAVSADMVAKTAKLKSFVNGKGQLALDLKVGGTLQKPSIGVDPKMLKRAAEDTLKKKATDALRHLLDKKKP
jgi:AsmA protein